MRAIIVFGIAITFITAFCRRDLVYPDVQMRRTAIVCVDWTSPTVSFQLYWLPVTGFYWPFIAGDEKKTVLVEVR